MESHDRSGFLLLDYPERSVWTTWTISFKAIKAKNRAATNLLLLWAFLDNKDLWHGLLHAATASAEHWPEWLHVMAANELRFVEAIKLLQSYSMIERVEDLRSYTTHPVVHRWASYIQDDDQREEFMQLAVMVVGLSVSDDSTKEYWILQRRLLPHADSCSHWILTELKPLYRREGHFDKESTEEVKNISVVLNATHLLGYLYANQRKLKEAEEMYQLALKGSETALGPNHISTLTTVNNLGFLYKDQGLLYKDQGKLKEAEEMYQRALKGSEKALGPNHASTLTTVNYLAFLYKDQGKLKEAKEMFQRALKGSEKALGPDHTSTLTTVNNLGFLYKDQGLLYKDQGKLKEAKEMFQRALEGSEKALGLDYSSTLTTVNNLGYLYNY
jgi:tetratricopeptide (TPR) repeat protein